MKRSMWMMCTYWFVVEHSQIGVSKCHHQDYIKSSLTVLEWKWHHMSYGAHRQLEKFINFWHRSVPANVFVTTINQEKNGNAHQATSNKMVEHSWICLLHITSFTNPKKFLAIFLDIPIHMNSVSLSWIYSLRNDKDLTVTNWGRTATRYRDNKNMRGQD